MSQKCPPTKNLKQFIEKYVFIIDFITTLKNAIIFKDENLFC
jgi:hypothetical protein